VIGGAGTGKTVLAVERAKQLSLEGFSVALVCYNDLLSRHLQQSVQDAPGVSASTFHSLCFRLASRAGLQIPSDPSRVWWESDAADMLIQAAESTGFSVDAVVIDEGQDFTTSWLVALNMILADSDNSPMYVFADSHQDLYERDWQLPDEWPRIPLDLNCRNTHQIAERVAAVYNEVPITNHVNGPKPRFVRVRRDRDLISDVPLIVDDLLRNEKMASANVVVLTDSPALAASIRELTVGQESFCEYGQSGVVVETIKRFKGLEADAVVAVFSEASTDSQESLRNSAYVALSRARSILLVLAPERVRGYLAWP
jgi:superfamily I DNA/RNA helicase